MEELIKKFLSVCSGSETGHGSGFGSGHGSIFCFGYGDGDAPGLSDWDGCGDYSIHNDGDGSGFGYGYGSDNCDGDGSGDGTGIKEFNHQKVYTIDNIPTVIDSVHGNYAVGKKLNSNLTTTPCYIAKVGNFFAHGETLKKALADALNKYEDNKPIEERIADFKKQYPSLDSIAEHSDLYRWHNILTGSCTFGRDTFAKDHNLDKDNGTMTVREFINLTRNAYSGNIIRQLEEAYK